MELESEPKINNFGSSTLLTVLYLHQPDNRCSLCEKFQGWLLATNQCCGARAASFRVEPEPIFYLAGAESLSLLFKVAPAASFWQEKKESLVLL